MQSAVAGSTRAGSEVGIAMGTLAWAYGVEHLSDTELIAGTRGLVARSNQHLARLLAHLAEVEARGIHRARACASLTTYCVYELRLSEDTAFRYARAARYAREFPVVLESLAAGALHLTGLLLLGPHLTEENHREVLKVAKHRSKREITRLVRQLDPLPSVPARIEPLGPTPAGTSANNASWEAYVHALNPVRELPLADCPNNWLHLGEDSAAAGKHSRESAEQRGVPAREPTEPSGAPERASSLRVQRYAVQFTARQEYVDLVERARDLLSQAVPDRSLEEVHLRAMRLLVAELEKRKFGVSGSGEPRRRGARGKNDAAVSAESNGPELGDEQRRPGEMSRAEIDSEMSPGATQPDVIDSGATRANEDASEPPHWPAKVDTMKTPRRSQPHATAAPAAGATVTARYVPAQVRREVYARAGRRCAFVSADGVRCRETRLLELHHVTPHARNGATTADNLALYCRAHNTLAAEHDFGRAFMARRSGRDLPPECAGG
ncbi:MAG TPA: HNH endonuclease signature motif containing protein [Polyangiaceae bacterium]